MTTIITNRAPRTEKVVFLVNEAEEDYMIRAAEKAGTTLSELIRQRVLNGYYRSLEQQEAKLYAEGLNGDG